MKISIAVPSLNYGRYLGACLDSVAAQDHRLFEVLIADGGSTDGSLEIARARAAADDRFRIVSTKDRGQADAVQRAFEAATGDVFAFLNADDLYLRPDALSAVAAAFSADPATDIVSFGGWYVDAAGWPLRLVRLRRHPADSLARLRYRPSVLQPGTFWRPAVQREVPFRTDLHYVFDAWFFYEVQGRYVWREFDTPIAGFRLHGRNKSMGVSAARVRELAAFEAHKFGARSARARYAALLARAVTALDGPTTLHAASKRAVYLAANSASFATAHRLPGI